MKVEQIIYTKYKGSMTETTLHNPQETPPISPGMIGETGRQAAERVELEEKKAILEGAVVVAETIVDQYPQVNADDELEYYFAGSLATMLLAQASSVEPADRILLPAVVPTSHIPISPGARTALQKMTRKIGDIDIALLPTYKRRGTGHAHNPGNPELPNEAKKQDITAGLKVTFPETAQAAIRNGRADIAEGRSPARIIIGGKEFYIPDPKVMLTFKTAHLVIKFPNYPDKGKLTTDFAALAEGLSHIYSRQQVVHVIHEALKHDPNLVLPTYDQRLGGTERTLLEEAVAMDENASYIPRLHVSQERTMGMLNILRGYKTPEAKQAVTTFINEHWEQLDQWEVSKANRSTRQVVIDHILANIDTLRPELEHDGADMDDLGDWLKTSHWIIPKYADMMPDQSGIERTPAQNDYLNVLANLDEEHLYEELAVLDKAISIPPESPEEQRGAEIREIFESAVANDAAVRRALFKGVGVALDNFDAPLARQFLKKLSLAAGDLFAEPGATTEERLTHLNACFNEFGMSFEPATR